MQLLDSDQNSAFLCRTVQTSSNYHRMLHQSPIDIMNPPIHPCLFRSQNSSIRAMSGPQGYRTNSAPTLNTTTASKCLWPKPFQGCISPQFLLGIHPSLEFSKVLSENFKAITQNRQLESKMMHSMESFCSSACLWYALWILMIHPDTLLLVVDTMFNSTSFIPASASPEDFPKRRTLDPCKSALGNKVAFSAACRYNQSALYVEFHGRTWWRPLCFHTWYTVFQYRWARVNCEKWGCWSFWSFQYWIKYCDNLIGSVIHDN